jgi:hypothetical protein
MSNVQCSKNWDILSFASPRLGKLSLGIDKTSNKNFGRIVIFDCMELRHSCQMNGCNMGVIWL